MSKKVRCIECSNSMHWSLPKRVVNHEYVKQCLCVARRSIVCSETMKTKGINHEQYCNKYIKKTELDKKCDETYNREIVDLENKIKEYES